MSGLDTSQPVTDEESLSEGEQKHEADLEAKEKFTPDSADDAPDEGAVDVTTE